MRRAVWLTVIGLAFGSAAKAGDFGDAIFATPLRTSPGTFIPTGSTLAAPVITPMGTKHGSTLFEVTPAGRGAETVLTREPGRYSNATRECTGWLTLEFLYWATQGPSAPPLVTTGPPLTGFGFDAAAGNPLTTTLLGGQRMVNGLRPGFRVEGGLFIGSTGDWAFGYSVISLGSRSERLEGGSDGGGIVNLPQFNSLLGIPIQTPIYVGYPGLTRGTVTASVQTSFTSVAAQLRRVAQSGTGFRFDLIAGYRFLHLGDSVATSFDVVSATLPGPASPRFQGEQSTRTRNEFDGGDLGIQFQGRVGKLTFDFQSTVAIGATTTQIDRSFTRSYIAGGPLGSLIGVPLPPVGVPLVQAGGLTQRSEFAFVPQVGIKFGWEPIDHVRVALGYDFLYWSRVRRAPEQFTGNDVVTDFWAQGVSTGIEFRY